MSLELKVQNLAKQLLPLMVKIGFVVFAIELGIMLFLPKLAQFTNPLVVSLIDAGVLALTVTPTAFFLIRRERKKNLIETEDDTVRVIQSYFSKVFSFFLPPFSLIFLVGVLIALVYYQTEKTELFAKLDQTQEQLLQSDSHNLTHQLWMAYADIAYLTEHAESFGLSPQEPVVFSATPLIEFLSYRTSYSALGFWSPYRNHPLSFRYDQGSSQYKANPSGQTYDFFRASPELRDAGFDFNIKANRESLLKEEIVEFSSVVSDQTGYGVLSLRFSLQNLMKPVLGRHEQSGGDVAVALYRGPIESPSSVQVFPLSHNYPRTEQNYRRLILEKPLKQFQQHKQLQVQTAEGRFYFHAISLSEISKLQHTQSPGSLKEAHTRPGLIIASHIPQKNIQLIIDQLRRKITIVFVVSILVLSLLIFTAVNAWVEKESHELELVDSTKKAEAATRAKSEFLANMSHEIRTPMNAIMGFSELLRTQTKDPKTESYIASIATSGKTLLSLINDILDLSKVEAGKMHLSPAPFELKKFLYELEQIFIHKIESKGLEFTWSFGPQVPPILTLDEVRLRQVLINLVSNSIKFTEVGSISIRMEALNIDPHFADLTIHVEDTGIGLPPEDASQIFGAFEQRPGQSHAKYGGTGLGLAISKRLIEMMGGTIWVDSEKRNGACFSIHLPKTPYAQQDEAPEPQAEQGTEINKFQQATILTISNQEVERTLIRNYLEDQPFTVIEADSHSVFERSKNQDIDLILIDFADLKLEDSMLAQGFKKHKITAPVIGMTTQSLPAEVSAGTIEISAWLTKPFSQANILSQLAEFLPLQTESIDFKQSLGRQLDNCGLVPAEWRALYTDLKEDYSSRWKQVQEYTVINQVEDFAIDLYTLGDSANCPPLCEWASSLRTAANLFNLEEIPLIISQFNILMELIELKAEL